VKDKLIFLIVRSNMSIKQVKIRDKVGSKQRKDKLFISKVYFQSVQTEKSKMWEFCNKWLCSGYKANIKKHRKWRWWRLCWVEMYSWRQIWKLRREGLLCWVSVQYECEWQIEWKNWRKLGIILILCSLVVCSLIYIQKFDSNTDGRPINNIYKFQKQM